MLRLKIDDEDDWLEFSVDTKRTLFYTEHFRVHEYIPCNCTFITKYFCSWTLMQRTFLFFYSATTNLLPFFTTEFFLFHSLHWMYPSAHVPQFSCILRLEKCREFSHFLRLFTDAIREHLRQMIPNIPERRKEMVACMSATTPTENP